MSEIQVRPAEIEDADAVYELLCQFAASYEPVRARFDENYPQLVQGEETELLVAVLDGLPIGYVLAPRMLTLYANGPIFVIQELFVKAEHRGLGAGSRLVEAVLQRAAEQGCAEVAVPTRRAPEYYPRFGFEVKGAYLKCRLTCPDEALA